MPPKKPQPSQPVRNSIRMDSDHLDELFNEIEASAHGSGHDPRRSHVRWQFRKTALPMQVFHAGSSATTIQVACRNMSSVGMSVFHSSFLHSGTRVVVSLTDIVGNTVKVEGTIVRCSHVRGICHELGVKFKHPIEARNFVKLDPFAEGFNLEKVNPQSVEGTVLYVDGSEMGQSLLKHFLRETRTRLRIAANVEEAARISAEGVDIILCDCAENGQAVADFVAGLRKKGSNTPAVFLTTEVDAASTAKYKVAQASAIIAKPLTQDVLLRARASSWPPIGTSASRSRRCHRTTRAPPCSRGSSRK